MENKKTFFLCFCAVGNVLRENENIKELLKKKKKEIQGHSRSMGSPEGG